MSSLSSVRPPGPSWAERLRGFIGSRGEKLRFLQRCSAQYGDVVDLSLGRPTYLLTAPDDIQYVLETNHLNYQKTRLLTGRSGRQLSGDGLLTSSGDAAVQQRRLLNPIVTRAAGDGGAGAIVRATEAMLARWQAGDEIDVHEEMIALTLHVMEAVLFALDFDSPEGGDFADAMRIRRAYLRQYFRWPIPVAQYLPTQTTRDYRRAVRFIDGRLSEMIRVRRQDAAPSADMLSALITLRRKDGTALSDKQVRDEAFTLASTGYETVAEALAWAWYLLAQHPVADATLAAEARRVAVDEPLGAPSVPRLQYAEQVFSEAMRLYPPTWIFVRIPQADDALPSGVRVPAGTKLYLCPYVTHRDSRYFPDPERFEPNRFTETARQTRPRLAYFPFAGGPRVCLGQRFAIVEGVLVLAGVAQRFRLELVPGQTIVPHPGLTLPPKHGIRLRVCQR